jgi:hypothetical protein
MPKLNPTSQLLFYEITTSGTDVNELAEFVGIPVERLWQIVRGDVLPTVSERISIADWFSVNPLVLWGTR